MVLVRLLYVCTAQFPQALVGVVENVPAAHTVWKEEPAGQEFPFVHAVPAVKPAVAQKVPTAHWLPVAVVLPVPTQLPAVQVPEQVGRARLPALPNVPAGQGITAVEPAGQ